MKSPRQYLITSVIALSLASGTTAFSQSVIYREVFGRATGGGNTSFSTYNWQVFTGTAATDESTAFGNTGISPEGTANSGSFSNVNNLAAVNSGAVTPVDNGRTFIFTVNTAFVFTNEYTVNRTANTISTITWDQRSDAGGNFSAAVQIGGNWYVSAAVAKPAVNGTNWGVVSLDFQNTTWSTLSFTGGSTLALGSSTSLPLTGDITGFGWYASTGAANSRLDGFTINAFSAVPEPSTYAALAGASVLGFAACRRRRSRA
ncbi:MAG: PEP-CTERM sorting domain-containing protein [Opitutaceae bacterium]|nr:PEP-CTERM sorting domain-containing protein [Opitutaceae bacterium]